MAISVPQHRTNMGKQVHFFAAKMDHTAICAGLTALKGAAPTKAPVAGVGCQLTGPRNGGFQWSVKAFTVQLRSKEAEAHLVGVVLQQPVSQRPQHLSGIGRRLLSCKLRQPLQKGRVQVLLQSCVPQELLTTLDDMSSLESWAALHSPLDHLSLRALTPGDFHFLVKVALQQCIETSGMYSWLGNED